MKIAIIADIHDNLANLERFLESAKNLGIEAIINCGDVTTPETLEWLAERFAGSIKLANGNMEIRREEFAEVAKRHKNLEVFAEIGELEVEGVKIAFVHRPDKVEEIIKESAQGGRSLRFVFYGHTHKPWIEERNGVIIANPGTLGGVFTVATFAVLDTISGQLELKKLY